MMFHVDPKWTAEELSLHKERWDLLRKMDNNECDIKNYSALAKRYHELNRILDDD